MSNEQTILAIRDPNESTFRKVVGITLGIPLGVVFLVLVAPIGLAHWVYKKVTK